MAISAARIRKAYQIHNLLAIWCGCEKPNYQVFHSEWITKEKKDLENYEKELKDKYRDLRSPGSPDLDAKIYSVNAPGYDPEPIEDGD